MKHLLTHEAVPVLVLAGNAELIFENTVTDKNRKYRIKHSALGINDNLSVFMDTLHAGYLGSIRNPSNNPVFKFPYQFKDEEQRRESIAFDYLFRHLFAGTLHSAMQIFHTGRCCACYRKLTDPVSIAVGIGPECRKNMG